MARKWTEAAKAYQATPEQVRRRVARNRARQLMIREGKAHVGDGTDVDHKVPLSKGGSTAVSNLRVVPRGENRSFKRNGHALASQTSTREMKHQHARKGRKA